MKSFWTTLAEVYGRQAVDEVVEVMRDALPRSREAALALIDLMGEGGLNSRYSAGEMLMALAKVLVAIIVHSTEGLELQKAIASTMVSYSLGEHYDATISLDDRDDPLLPGLPGITLN